MILCITRIRGHYKTRGTINPLVTPAYTTQLVEWTRNASTFTFTQYASSSINQSIMKEKPTPSRSLKPRYLDKILQFLLLWSHCVAFKVSRRYEHSGLILNMKITFWRLNVRTKLSNVALSTTYKKIRDDFFFVFELFLKNRENCCFDHHRWPPRVSKKSFGFGSKSLTCAMAFPKSL